MDELLRDMTLGQLLSVAAHFVFYCSVASLFLACVERSVHKFFPGSGADKAVSFTNDLLTQFGALNLRDKIAGPPPPELERRRPASDGK